VLLVFLYRVRIIKIDTSYPLPHENQILDFHWQGGKRKENPSLIGQRNLSGGAFFIPFLLSGEGGKRKDKRGDLSILLPPCRGA